MSQEEKLVFRFGECHERGCPIEFPHNERYVIYLNYQTMGDGEINVYKCLLMKKNEENTLWHNMLADISEEYIKLKPAERYAIRWHMGPYSGQQDWTTLGMTMDKYLLVLALFEADMEATHLMEK